MYNVVADMTAATNGVPINIKDIVNDNLLDYVEGLNPSLGSATDEYYQKYQQFLEKIGSRDFDIIRVEDVARNQYKDYDLSEKDNPLLNAATALIGDFLLNMKAKITAKDRFDENNIIESQDGTKYINSNYIYNMKDYKKNREKYK